MYNKTQDPSLFKGNASCFSPTISVIGEISYEVALNLNIPRNIMESCLDGSSFPSSNGETKCMVKGKGFVLETFTL